MKRETEQLLSINGTILAAMVIIGIAGRPDYFGVLEKYPLPLFVLGLANIILGQRKTWPSFFMTFVVFLAFHHNKMGHSDLLPTISPWLFGFGLVCAIGIGIDLLHLSVIKELKRKSLEEKRWNKVLTKTLKESENTIEAMKWRIGIETQPISQIFQFSKRLINANLDHIGKIALTLIQRRFGVSQCGFYMVSNQAITLVEATKGFSGKWPSELNAENLHRYPNIATAVKKKIPVSPRDYRQREKTASIVVPSIGDTGALRGLIVVDGIQFMQLTPFIVEYIAEVASVCGPALEASIVEKATQEKKRDKKFRFIEPDRFEEIRNEINRLESSNPYKSQYFYFSGLNRLHGRQTKILLRLIEIQLERSIDAEGLFTFRENEMVVLFSGLRRFSVTTVMESIEDIFLGLGISEIVSVREVHLETA